MRRLRFNQIFGLLLVLCILSAFVWPGQVNPSWSNAQIIFAPIAQPMRRGAAWLLGNIRPVTTGDHRPDADIRAENQQLKVEVTQLQGQLKTLAKMAAERRELGGLLNYCVATSVIGADSDDRQSLNVQQTDPAALHNGQIVVCPLGLVGRIQNASAAGAKVLLITDKSARPTSVSFGRLIRQENGQYFFQRLATDKTLLYGDGANELIARQGLTIAQVKSADLRIGDWAIVDDPDYPLALAGLRVGQITDIRASVTGPLYADIFLHPTTNLAELQEVLVVTKY